MISANAYQLRVLEPPCTLVTYCLLKENDTNNQILRLGMGKRKTGK